jgi:hypothetical protein
MSEPLDKLAAFYKSLDDIPTPALTLRRLSLIDYGKFALAPLAAALLAFGFMMICAYGPADAKPYSPVTLPIDRYALSELKSAPPAQPAPKHTNAQVSRMRLI